VGWVGLGWIESRLASLLAMTGRLGLRGLGCLGRKEGGLEGGGFGGQGS